MASPYRTRPPTPPRVRSIDQRRRISVASLVFGMLCGVTGISLADEGRAECALLFTGVCGFVLLLQR